MATRKRSRHQDVVVKRPADLDNVLVQQPQVRVAGREQVVEVKAGPEAQTTETLVSMQGPFTTKGSNVFDAFDRRVVLCGYDHNRETSGPSIADTVAAALNKFFRTTPPVQRDEP